MQVVGRGDTPDARTDEEGEDEGAERRGAHPPRGAQAVLIPNARSADCRARADVGGEQRAEEQAGPQISAGDEKVPGPAETAADPQTEQHLGGGVSEDEREPGHRMSRSVLRYSSGTGQQAWLPPSGGRLREALEPEVQRLKSTCATSLCHNRRGPCQAGSSSVAARDHAAPADRVRFESVRGRIDPASPRGCAVRRSGDRQVRRGASRNPTGRGRRRRHSGPRRRLEPHRSAGADGGGIRHVRQIRERAAPHRAGGARGERFHRPHRPHGSACQSAHLLSRQLSGPHRSANAQRACTRQLPHAA